MIPIVTPLEMAAIDAAAPEPVEVLIERAGAAVARAAWRMLGGGYGRRVLVVAGKGNNGNDARVAARLLARRGVRCVVVGAAGPVPGEVVGQGRASLAGFDLVLDGAYGTGFEDRGGWSPPDYGPVPVLAVDIPSGVSGLTGAAVAGVGRAQRTVSFAALKAGLVLQPGRSLAGAVEVVDIGLDTSEARAGLVGADDLAAWLVPRPVDAHKWAAACWVIAGSPPMPGAAHLAARAAQRAGAGYVRLSSPGMGADPGRPTEAVGWPLDEVGWARSVVDSADRFGAVVVGPGLGLDPRTTAEVRALVGGLDRPVVVDGDGLTALGRGVGGFVRARRAPTVLTPHDGEYERLAAAPVGSDRFAAVRSLAERSGAVVLLKGPTTLVADPSGSVLAVAEGDARLATAGTGDVLAGMIGALLARGIDPLEAAAAAAFWHGRAGAAGPASGLIASDLIDLVPEAARLGGWQ